MNENLIAVDSYFPSAWQGYNPKDKAKATTKNVRKCYSSHLIKAWHGLSY